MKNLIFSKLQQLELFLIRLLNDLKYNEFRKVIIYPQENGRVAILYRVSRQLPLLYVALKDVPDGVPFKIISKSKLPLRKNRDKWKVDFEKSYYRGFSKNEMKPADEIIRPEERNFIIDYNLLKIYKILTINMKKFMLGIILGIIFGICILVVFSLDV